MSLYDGPWCLTTFDRLAQRPVSDQVTDAEKYLILSEAQIEVYHHIASIYPYPLYKAAGPTAMTTSDNKVYTFGTGVQGDYADAPLGYVKVFRNLSDYPDCALVEGVDYLNEGTQIRIPNNRTESALYWQGVPMPDDIDASTAPTLRPAPARILIVIKAVENFALEGDRNPGLADAMERRWATEFPRYMLAWKAQHNQGSALGMSGVDRAIARQGGI